MSSPNQQTLLEMTQEILTSMQSDEVDSITDTQESTAVARLIRRTYWDLFGILDNPEHYTLFQLDETSASTPTLMKIPDNVMSVSWIKYDIEQSDDTDPIWVEIPIRALDQADSDALKLQPSEDNVESFSYAFGPDSMPWYYTNDAAPTWYTTPDDYSLLFNSYDSDVETYLRASKTRAYGLVDPTFTFSDSFVPDLDARQFPLLFNEAKALCFAELKQTQNAKAENRARKLLISNQRTKYRVGKVPAYDSVPDYGRKHR